MCRIRKIYLFVGRSQWYGVLFRSLLQLFFAFCVHEINSHCNFDYDSLDETACKTLFRFDTETHTWEKPNVSGVIPGARDGHSAVVIRNQMIVFGGYEEDIGLFSQDIYSLNLSTLHWSFVPVNVRNPQNLYKFVNFNNCCMTLAIIFIPVPSFKGQPPSYRDFHSATAYLDRYM